MSLDVLGVLNAVADYLAAQGVGTLGTDLFAPHLPPNPQNAVVVFSTGGFRDTTESTRFPTFSIQVRNSSVKSALDKAKTINDLLDNSWNVLTGFPGRISLQAEFGLLFKDEAGNTVCPLNYLLTLSRQNNT